MNTWTVTVTGTRSTAATDVEDGKGTVTVTAVSRNGARDLVAAMTEVVVRRGRRHVTFDTFAVTGVRRGTARA